MRLGRWETVKLLGRGGMGEVWLGRDAERGEEVAIKRLLAAAPGSDSLLRFQRESQALLRLRDPAVVAWRDAGQDEAGRPWVAMELVRGGTLEDLVTRSGPLAPRQAVELVRDLCGGLAAVHASGVLHRDLKPANVLLDEGQRPKLTDFGLTRPIARGGSQTETGAIMGSPGYMPPEQVTGAKEELGPATDVYGLGAVLFFLLTGQAPFGGESVLRCLESILRDPPPAPSTRRPGVPAALDAIAQRCLSKSPAGRYPSARALQGALQGWLDVEEEARGEASPARIVAALGALLLGLAAVVVVRSLYRSPGPPAPSPPPPALAPVPAPAGDVPSEARRAEAGRLLARALARGRAGDREGALADYRQALALDPRNAQTYRDRGRLRMQLRDWQGAKADFEQAIALEPQEATTYLNRAGVREELGDPKGALQDFSQAIALSRHTAVAPVAYRGRARLRFQLAELSGAREDYDRAIALDPQEARTFCDRAVVRARLGDHAGAIADYGRAIELNPRDPVPFSKRADEREQQGDLAGAIEDHEKVIELGHEHPLVPAARAAVERLRSQLAREGR